MIRPLTGIQIGPRQLELPPNMPLSDSAGRYPTPIFLVSQTRNDIGMFGMVAGESSDPVGAEEFVLVEHLSSAPAEAWFRSGSRRASGPAVAGLSRIMDVALQLWTSHRGT